MTNILITGGAGFIGSHMADHYYNNDDFVVVIDNLSSGSTENLMQIILNSRSNKFRLIMDDLGTADLVKILEEYKIEVIHHFAARPRVGYSVNFPVESNEQNVSNTVRVLNAARKVGVRRVVYSAFSSAYGNCTVFPTSEKEPTNPLSPYALQKLVGEEYCRLFSSLYGLDTVCLRYFNVFGPRSLADSQYSAVIPIFIEQITFGKPVTIDGAGEQSRDFTYVSNVVHGNWLAATYKGKFHGETFNVAYGDNITINGLVKELERLIGKSAEVLHREPRPGDAFKTQADVTRIKETLGYQPIVSFDEGLNKTVEWYTSYLRSVE